MKIFKLVFFFVALLLAAGAFAQSQKIIMVEILFNGGQAKIGEVTGGQGYAQEPEKEAALGPNQYWLELLSSSGQTLEMRKFSVNQRLFQRPPGPGDAPGPAVNLLDKFNKVITLPYYDNIKMLKLYDANKKLLDQKDVSFLIPGCGDEQCSNKENYLICSSDCPAGGQDGLCNQALNKIDPDCQVNQSAKASAANQKPSARSYFWLMAGGLAVLLIIIVIAIYVMRKGRTGLN